MRLAKVRDYRRRLRDRKDDWKFRLRRFTFSEIPTIGSGELVFNSPLTILAGPNGVGKTTLLRALWSTAASANAELEPSISMRFTSGNAELGYTLGGEEKSAKVTFAKGDIQGGDQIIPEVLHLDTSSQIKTKQDYFCSFPNVEDLTNGVGVRAADESMISEINYISRREYREINLYEVEIDSAVTPFFEVAIGNDRYDSRTMGAGELALLQLWWAIDRADNNSLVLIEEIETFLSPISQESLVQYLIASTVDKRLCVVATSHSPRVIGSVDEESLVFLFRDDGALKAVEGLAPPALLDTIGIRIGVNAAVLVEDELAELFLRQILERKSARLSRRIEISPRNGEGNISALLKRVSPQFRGVKVIGVFDGDQRGKIDEDIAFASAILPGEEAIEQIFRKLAQTAQVKLKAATGSNDLPAIIYSLQGEEEHNWYSKLCENLGLNRAQMFQIFFRIWEDEEASDAAMDQLVQDLERLLS